MASLNPYTPLSDSFENVKTKLQQMKTRSLEDSEIDLLKSQLNQSSDPSWKNVRVMIVDGKERIDLTTIRCCSFLETNVISSQCGIVSYDPDLQLPSGITLSVFRNCIIFPDCYLYQNTLIENAVILENSIIMGCGRISCQAHASFGNDVYCNMGNETGGYFVRLDGDLEYNNLYSIITNGEKMKTNELFFDYSILGPNVLIENCSLLDSVMIGEHAHILASYMKNCSVISTCSCSTLVSNGNAVDSILQWGVHLESGSNCCQSLLCEHSYTDCNAKIVNSIIAPNTGVSSGECNSSLVGPFIGFHHNSVLISAIWFEGKGNIGYGANIGSNHTGRLPDQECYPGEGVFFGLGCNIKYPCNFKHAPYSLIASGITLLPQKVEMPFSLINKPSHTLDGVSPAYNEIMPGWALYDNYYMIIRNEDKFRQRNKSKRSMFETEVLREDIIQLCVKARSYLLMSSRLSKDAFLDLDSFGTLKNSRTSSFDLLRAIGEESEQSDEGSCTIDTVEEKEYYTDHDINGIGKNFITNKNRLHGISIYSFFIRLFYLRKVKEILLTLQKQQVAFSLNDFLSNSQWLCIRKILVSECKKNTLKGMMEALFSMEMLLLQNAIRSKKKDFDRGRKIIDTYDVTHNYEVDMRVVEKRKKPLEEEKSQIQAILKRIDPTDELIIG